MELPVSISQIALDQLSKVKKIHDEIPAIRIGIKGGGGCGGVAYSLGIDNITDKDKVYIKNDLTFVIEAGHLMHLVGLSIDYLEEGDDKGFVFESSTHTEEPIL